MNFRYQFTYIEFALPDSLNSSFIFKVELYSMVLKENVDYFQNMTMRKGNETPAAYSGHKTTIIL